MAKFSETDLLAISEVFGHPNDGLTESELNSAFEICGFPLDSSLSSRTQTIYRVLEKQQATGGDRRSVLAFLRVSMRPGRFEANPERFSRLRAQLNEQLMLCGLQVDEDGSLSKTKGLEDEQIGLLRFVLRFMLKLIGFGWLVG